MREESMEIGHPEGLEFFHHGSYIEIVRRWWNWGIVVLTVFAVFWDRIFLSFYSTLSRGDSLVGVLIQLPFVLIGVSLTYRVIAGWLNKTHIYVSHQKLSVQHKPVSWRGSKAIPVSEIKQLYAKNNASSHGYEVHVITHSGKNIKLISRLNSSEQALFIEQEIERFLNILDVPVKGEIGKSHA